MNKIVAIVGMCGSGKSIASDILEKKGFQKVYFGGVTLEKLKEKGLEVTPENEKMMREKLREDLGENAKYTIQRYKGLGEMDAEQLWETTMNPQKRVLWQIDLDDAMQADTMFDILMGEKVEPRREFIQEHAQEAELDL